MSGATWCALPLVAVLALAQVGEQSAQTLVGACCLPNANCLVLTEAQCALIDRSNWAGPGTDCTDFEEIGTADACELRVPKLYWLTGEIGRPEEGTLMRANLDGTEVERLAQFGSGRSVFVDWPTGKLYFGLRRFELNAANPTPELLVGGTLSSLALWVDHAGQKLYWSDPTNRMIFRAGLNIPDGQNPETRTDVVTLVQNTTATWLAIVAPSDDCGRTSADANHDGDIDLRDFRVFQNCFSGPNN
jgi:hypothetical protein